MNTVTEIRSWLRGENAPCPKCEGTGEDREWGRPCQMCGGSKTAALPHAGFQEFFGGTTVLIRRQDGKEITIGAHTFAALANEAVWSEL